MQACECVDGWNHTEGRCSINHMEMEGCPQLESLRRCDGSATQSWCETTFTKCREQGYVRPAAFVGFYPTAAAAAAAGAAAPPPPP